MPHLVSCIYCAFLDNFNFSVTGDVFLLSFWFVCICFMTGNNVQLKLAPIFEFTKFGVVFIHKGHLHEGVGSEA